MLFSTFLAETTVASTAWACYTLIVCSRTKKMFFLILNQNIEILSNGTLLSANRPVVVITCKQVVLADVYLENQIQTN